MKIISSNINIIFIYTNFLTFLGEIFFTVIENNGIFIAYIYF